MGVGVPVGVSRDFCRLTCPKWGGPHNGQAANDLSHFLFRVLQMYFNAGWSRDWLSKVFYKYQTPVFIRRPPNIESLRRQLAPLIESPDVHIVGVTGSAIVGSVLWPPKDIDIVIVPRDPVAAWSNEVKLPRVPKVLDGLTTDTFLMAYPSTWFVTLDIMRDDVWVSPRLELQGLEDGLVRCDAHGQWAIWDQIMDRVMLAAKDARS